MVKYTKMAKKHMTGHEDRGWTLFIYKELLFIFTQELPVQPADENGATSTRDAKKIAQQLTTIICFRRYLKNTVSIQEIFHKFSRTGSLLGLDVDWSLEFDHLNFLFFMYENIELSRSTCDTW